MSLLQSLFYGLWCEMTLACGGGGVGSMEEL